MKSHVRPTYTVGIDDISAWGQELCFSPEHPTVIQASGEGWEDFKSREKINSNPVNLAMTFVDMTTPKKPCSQPPNLSFSQSVLHSTPYQLLKTQHLLSSHVAVR